MQKIRYAPNENWVFNMVCIFQKPQAIRDTTGTFAMTMQVCHVMASLYYGPQKWLMNTVSLTNSKTTVLYDALDIRLAHQFFEEVVSAETSTNPIVKFEFERNAYSINTDFKKAIIPTQFFMVWNMC